MKTIKWHRSKIINTYFCSAVQELIDISWWYDMHWPQLRHTCRVTLWWSVRSLQFKAIKEHATICLGVNQSYFDLFLITGMMKGEVHRWNLHKIIQFKWTYVMFYNNIMSTIMHISLKGSQSPILIVLGKWYKIFGYKMYLNFLCHVTQMLHFYLRKTKLRNNFGSVIRWESGHWSRILEKKFTDKNRQATIVRMCLILFRR